MKSIPNKLTTIEMAPKEGENGAVPHAEYADIIDIVLNTKRQEGFSYEDIENRIAIRAATKAAKGKTGTDNFMMIELEDSYFKYLQDLVKNNRWGFWHEDLLMFKDDILNIK